jgi:hypothetical protein
VEYQLDGFVPAAGTARSVIVEGSLAYVASDEFGVAVVDVSNPNDVVPIGAPTLPFEGDRLAKSGSTVVVTSREGGLHVVDVSDPARPVTRGALNGIVAEDVALRNGYAYVRVEVPGNPSHVDLAVVDLRVPSAPSIVKQIYLPGGDEVEVVGTRLYVTTGSQLRVFDIGSPANPVARGSVTISGGARDLAVSGTWAYVGNNTSLAAVDAANPSSPYVAGTLSGTSAALAVDGSRLYRISGGSLQVVSVSNPRSPQLLGSGEGYSASGVAARNGTAYLASPQVDISDGEGGLYVCDVSIPAAQQLQSQAPAGVGNADVSSDGTLALVASRETGLHVVDVTSPDLPEWIGGIDGIGAIGVAKAGDYAYVRVEVPGNPAHVDLVTVDLRNPANPTIVDQYYLPGGDEIEIMGSYLYLTTGSQLRVFSISNPTRPSSVATLSPPGGARDLAVTANYALVGNSTQVHVVDLSNPTRPTLRGALSGGTTSLAAQGSWGYASSGGTLRVVNFENPGAPTVVQTVDSLGAADLGTSGGDFVLVASPSLGLGIYRVSATDGSLSLSAQTAVPGLARSVSAHKGTFFVGDTASSVATFRVNGS